MKKAPPKMTAETSIAGAAVLTSGMAAPSAQAATEVASGQPPFQRESAGRQTSGETAMASPSSPQVAETASAPGVAPPARGLRLRGREP